MAGAGAAIHPHREKGEVATQRPGNASVSRLYTGALLQPEHAHQKHHDSDTHTLGARVNAQSRIHARCGQQHHTRLTSFTAASTSTRVLNNVPTLTASLALLSC